MGQSYWKNAALLTGSDVVLRLAGMGLRIWLANALGGEGMGLYQLVLAVYALFVTLATAGVSVAATRLMAEELARGRGVGPGHAAASAGTGAGLGLRPWRRSTGWRGWRPGGGWEMCGRRARCGVSALGCRGWPCRRCCGVLYRPAAGGPQRGQPAGRADGAHRGGADGPVRHTGRGT